MIFIRNGWIEDKTCTFNRVNGYFFGFNAYKYDNGNLYSYGMYIGNKRFGWFECYHADGSMMNECGNEFYIYDYKKI